MTPMGAGLLDLQPLCGPQHLRNHGLHALLVLCAQQAALAVEGLGRMAYRMAARCQPALQIQ